MSLALTFDDGPDPVWTPRVLEALAACEARATFFVLGPAVRRHPELVRRAVAEGHVVAPHADAHLSHWALTEEEADGDLDAVLSALTDAGVTPAPLWRPPYGEEARWTRALARRRGLRVVGWTADTNDWQGHDAAAMLAAVAPEVREGAVVLAHDAVGPGALRTDCAQTVALIAPLVALGRSRGLEPAPLG